MRTEERKESEEDRVGEIREVIGKGKGSEERFGFVRLCVCDLSGWFKKRKEKE